LQKVILSEKFKLFKERWTPKIVGELNGQHVKIAKLQGEFVWHKHDEEDELFLVIKGQLTIAFRDYEEVLNPGEFIIVPRGIEHKPYAEKEVEVMLFEPKSTLNTGNAGGDLTQNDLEKI
jgi:mannose-6-phosphate isomerase-like protein (cupin superfamily)